MLRGSISILMTFGTPENYRMESILFDVADVNLPFNAILGRPALYQFMIIAHYGYLVLKMLLPMASTRSMETALLGSLRWRSFRPWR
jgi:hypothetical protein